MNNLKSMLSKTPFPMSPPPQSNDNETQICVKLPLHFVEYVRDFQYQEAIKTGNLHFSFKDAISSIIAKHQSENPKIVSRPEIVKASERKAGRKPKVKESVSF